MCVIWVYTVDTTCPGIELDGARYSGLEYKVEVGGVDGLVFFPLLLVFAKLVGNSSWRKIEQNKEAHTCFYHRIHCGLCWIIDDMGRIITAEYPKDMGV